MSTAVIKNHEILGPSKLSAASHSLSGGYLPYYIQSALRQQILGHQNKRTKDGKKKITYVVTGFQTHTESNNSQKINFYDR